MGAAAARWYQLPLATPPARGPSRLAGERGRAPRAIIVPLGRGRRRRTASALSTGSPRRRPALLVEGW